MSEGDKIWLWVGKLAGALAITGIALIAIAIYGHSGPEWQSLLWFYLLCAGAACSLVGGIAWPHTRGWRPLKTATLGLVCGSVGATLGVLLGDQIRGSRGRWEVEAMGVFAGFWIGAILCGWLGIWWGMRITQFFQRAEPIPENPNSD